MLLIDQRPLFDSKPKEVAVAWALSADVLLLGLDMAI